MLVGAVAWVLGWLSGWTEFMYIAGAAVVAVLTAIGLTFGRIHMTGSLRLEPSRVVVGEQAVAEISLTNLSARRMLPVRLEVPVGKAVAQFAVPSLAGRSSHEELFIIPTTRRAVVDVGPIRTVRGDPLGLARREVQLSEPEELFIHPRTVRLSGLAAGWLRDLEGQSTKDLSNSDVNFHALREYVPGDDRRHVHWRTSARLGKLMVRQFVDTRRSHLALLLSTDPAQYADAEEFELAVSMVASLGLRALADGQTASFIVDGRPHDASSGQRLLDNCARVQLGDTTRPLDEVLAVANQHIAKSSVAVIATGSALTPAQLRQAADRCPRDVRTVGLRAAPSEEAGFRLLGRANIVAAPTLQEFARLMWAVSR
jgi:uncharacterized protein (DUF58 family)